MASDQRRRIESAAAYQSECRPGGPYGALETEAEQVPSRAPPQPTAISQPMTRHALAVTSARPLKITSMLW